MANVLLDIGMITNEALVVLENTLKFTKQVNRQYDDQFAQAGAKIGDTLNIRKPVRYLGRNGPTLAVEGTQESSVPLVLSNQWGQDTSFTSKELTLDIDEFSDRILKPAIATVANLIDVAGMQLYKNVWNQVGNPGTTPTSLQTYLDAGVKLDNGAAPNDDERAIVLNPRGQASIVGNLINVFNPQQSIADQYKEGTMGMAAGFKWSMDQNVQMHTTGTFGGSPTSTNTSTNGDTTLVTGGWTVGGTVVVGDIFTIGNVYAVNPQSRQTTGELQQFVVTAANTADSSGNMTIAVQPAIISSGAFQTVNSLPQAGAAITPWANPSTVSPQNLAFHKDAFTLATVDLEMPGGVDMAARKSDKKLGVSMRLVRAYDITNDRFPCRFDVLGGWATLRPELACRVAG